MSINEKKFLIVNSILCRLERRPARLPQKSEQAFAPINEFSYFYGLNGIINTSEKIVKFHKRNIAFSSTIISLSARKFVKSVKVFKTVSTVIQA